MTGTKARLTQQSNDNDAFKSQVEKFVEDGYLLFDDLLDPVEDLDTDHR